MGQTDLSSPLAYKNTPPAKPTWLVPEEPIVYHRVLNTVAMTSPSSPLLLGKSSIAANYEISLITTDG